MARGHAQSGRSQKHLAAARRTRPPVTIYKQIITKSGDKFSFSVEPLITKTWKDKFYLFPIQEKEMNKSPLLEQNPGWGLEE